MTWFAELFGFPESHKTIGRNITIQGDQMHSAANDRSFRCGTLATPTLAQLRAQAAAAAEGLPGSARVREVVADAAALHGDPANAGALFQVASQFNLLEMVSPEVTPDRGITRYEGDRTQGPVCAIACAAGTLQRNWFEQTSADQIDTLAAVGESLGNSPDRRGRGRWWEMRNGYALLTGQVPNDVPDHHDELRIGVHKNTEVTAGDAGHLVTQAYCSALPITYSSVAAIDVEPLAQMVLNSAYEATLAAAVVNASEGGNPTVFLTLLGGGVFGNPIPWIADAIERAVGHYGHVALDVVIVSYGQPQPAIAHLLG